MAHYDDIIMPATVRFGSRSGPRTSTQVVLTGGGFRKANRRWDQHLRRLDLTYVSPIATVADIAAIFEAVEGPANSFLVRDWGDWNSRTDGNLEPGAESGVTAFDQVLRNTTDQTFVGDGSTRTFQMVKRYVKGSATHVRTIKKPLQGTIKVGVDGVEVLEGSPTDFTVDYSAGIVTFQTAPGDGVSPTAVPVTWGGAFYLPVAFVEDELPQTLRTGKTSGVSNLSLIEVRL